MTESSDAPWAALGAATVLRQFVDDVRELQPITNGSIAGGDLPFCSVVVRTQGGRASLDDALTCLAAQTDDDLEVVLVVHTADEGDDASAAVDDVRSSVGAFHPAFADRVRVVHEVGGGRSAPLNRGLDEARGRYVAFLDDDDLVAANWVEEFRAAADAEPGRVARTVCLLQEHRRTSDGLIPYEPVGGLSAPYEAEFSYLQHRALNQSPICSWALPKAEIDALGIRFDDELPVLEDWDLLLRATELLGVTNRVAYTSIYRRFVDTWGSTVGIEKNVWLSTKDRIMERLDRRPSLVPPGAAAEYVALAEDAFELTRQRDHAVHELEQLPVALARIEAYERSRYWKMTAPLRWLTGRRGELLGRARAKLGRA